VTITKHNTSLFSQIYMMVFGLAMAAFINVFHHDTARADDFDDIIANAEGKTVYFNAWGGSPAINSYIDWVATRVADEYGITLVHVKLSATSDAVSRILAEKTAGKSVGGSVDLIWINGENFAAMKHNDLLRSDSWAYDLPSFVYTDPVALPGILNDFGVPTDGQEAPWGRAQFIFGYDTAYVDTPPRSAAELAAWIASHPGRFSYPKPSDFIGMSFLKQILLETSPDISPFAKPVDQSNADQALTPLWQWLDAVHPHLRQGGKHFPANYTAMIQMLGDGELSIAFAFNPAEFSNGIAQGILPDTVRSYVHDGGTLANVHFVAIPFNANAPEAAQVVANFLLSPEAQSHKAHSDIWGDPTVLALDKLPPDMQMVFATLPLGIATLDEESLGKTLPEFHPSWVPYIEKQWADRYTGQ
jgi:putative thiamine transport system substrate-binding protein